MDDHSEERLVNQFCPQNVILKLGEGGRFLIRRFKSFLIMSKTGKCCLSASDIVLESLPGSDSTNARIKHMPIPVASHADKDYYRN